jgi:hypothetical protein
MDGDYCLDLGQGHYVIKILPATKSEIYAALRYRCGQNYVGTQTIIGFLNAGGQMLAHLRWNYGVLRAYRGTGTKVADGSTGFTLNTTYLIEVYYQPADSGGRFVVKVNGAIEIDFTGDTMDNSGPVGQVQMGWGGSNNGGGCSCDNVILDDAEWIGETFIKGLAPNGAGASSQWTPSAGNNHECVDEVPVNDLDYVSTNANDQLDLYACADLGAVSAVKCVQVQARAVKSGTPTPTHLKIAVRTGGAEYFSGDLAVPLAYPKSLCHLWGNNPNTGAAWTGSQVDGMEVGMKSAA